MNQYINSIGIVINKRRLRESDLLITLLTPNQGKIVALAKGAQNIKSNRLGSLQLGNIIKASFYTKNNFTWLAEAQTTSQFLLSPKNLTQINLLFYFLEFLNLVIAENQQIDGIYDSASKIINYINKNQLKNYISEEINFIKILGFGIPNEIERYYDAGDYKTSQQLIKGYLESLVEKPLESNKLFK